MKSFVAAATLMFAANVAFAQSGDMKGMDMKGMDMKSRAKSDAFATHRATGVVKKVDTKARTATLAHEPVKSLNWPAMSMTFQVQDQGMLERLSEGKKVEVEFEKRGKDYVITSVK